MVCWIAWSAAATPAMSMDGVGTCCPGTTAAGARGAAGWGTAGPSCAPGGGGPFCPPGWEAPAGGRTMSCSLLSLLLARPPVSLLSGSLEETAVSKPMVVAAPRVVSRLLPLGWLDIRLSLGRDITGVEGGLGEKTSGGWAVGGGSQAIDPPTSLDFCFRRRSFCLSSIFSSTFSTASSIWSACFCLTVSTHLQIEMART